MKLRHPLLAFLAAGLLGALTGLATAESGGAPLPPPMIPCASDAECQGCSLCLGGFCEYAPLRQPTCMCDGECAAAGLGSCDLSPVKPLCGGRCRPGGPASGLVCGSGHDAARVDPFTGAIGAAAAAVESDERVIIEVGRP